jgi:hypothetical protein
MRCDCDRGQALVETLWLVPVAAAVIAAVAMVGIWIYAGSEADAAAEAAAIALIQGSDPAAAARASVPGWGKGSDSLRVTARGGRVLVSLTPNGLAGGLAPLLAAESVLRVVPSNG